jgi:hypothetical protein
MRRRDAFSFKKNPVAGRLCPEPTTGWSSTAALQFVAVVE